jgi:hypothetical protein
MQKTLHHTSEEDVRREYSVKVVLADIAGFSYIRLIPVPPSI